MKISPGFGHLSKTYDYHKRAPGTFEARVCLKGDGVIWLTLAKLHTSASEALAYAKEERERLLRKEVDDAKAE